MKSYPRAPDTDTVVCRMADEKKPQPLGRILLRQKLISQGDLDSALADQAGTPLASRLIERGLVTEIDALRALSEQHGVPGIELSQVAIFLEHLVVPREVAEAHKILPVLVKGDRVFLAMADPTDKRVIDELEFVTGKKVYPYVALTGNLLKAIHAAYDARGQSEIYYLGPNVTQETLNRLGLSDRSDPGHAPTSDSTLIEPRPVMDEQTRTSSTDLQISTTDLGNVTTEDSTIAQLPSELRIKVNAATPDKTEEPTGKLVLIVDDEEDIRKMLKRLLVGKGHRVIEADRGLLALRMVKENTPDLIILDAMLPEVHGFDIARRIKGSDKYGKIPIIMISAVYRGWRIAEDLKASYGISAYLEKPFKIADVVAAVARALTDGPLPSAQAERDMSAEAEKALADGIAAYKEGNVDDALALLKHGVSIDPLAFRLRFQLGLLYGKRGMVYEGIQELEKSIEISPKHFSALKNLAILYEKAGFRHRAIEVWERAVHVAPDEPTKTQIKGHLIGLL